MTNEVPAATRARDLTEPHARSLLRDLRRLSEVAGGLTAVALLLGGAGPGVLLKLLGLDHAGSMVGTIVSTAPLSVNLGAVLIILTVYRETASLKGTFVLLSVAAFVSLTAAVAMGQIAPADLPPGPPPLVQPSLEAIIGAVFGGLLRIIDTVTVFFRAYGPARFALAVAGGIFIWYAYVSVLLPRLGPRPPAKPRA